MNSKLYDKLKFTAQVFLPVLGALYFVLSESLGLPSTSTIVGIIVIIDAILGVGLYLAANAYANNVDRFDGAMHIHENGTSKKYTLSLNSDPEKLDEKDEILFKVSKPPK